VSHQDKRVPQTIRRVDGGLEFVWGDGEPPVRLDARALRLACPCAACVDEMTGHRVLDPGAVPADIHVVGVELVGAYGIRIRWSDGHATGIYTFEWLRSAKG